ncbi:MAG: DUF5119 domain-containing protein [Bacteroides sp.]|nr:DUF5119 domain-containing protein [Bacteroides sp.]
MNTKTLCAAIGLTALLCLASCNHKSIDFDYTGNTRLKVNFDWQNAPEAEPVTMSLYLFPDDDDESQRYEFTNKSGGDIQAAYGEYTAICLNSYTEHIEYRNTDSQSTFELTTGTTTLLRSISTLGVRSSSAPRAAGTEDERIAYSPDPSWTDHNESVAVIYGDTTRSVTFYPSPCYCIYTVKIVNCENLEYVSATDGSISGMAGGWIPAQEALSSEKVTIPFSTVIGEDYTTLTAEFTTFGHCPDNEEGTHTLMIYAVLADGNKYSYSYDVTEQVHGASDPYHVLIELDGLPLPQPIENGSGMQPEVDGWSQENVYVDM